MRNSNGTFKKGHKSHQYWLGKKRPGIGDKVRAKLLGKKLPAETCKKMSMARLGKPQPWNEGRKFSEEHKAKIGKKGKDHWNWQGGKSLINDRHDSAEYKRWRRAVYKRDGFTCVKCGVLKDGKNVVLNAHHIIGWMDSIDLRYEIKNGITLCVECHEQTPSYCRQMITMEKGGVAHELQSI